MIDRVTANGGNGYELVCIPLYSDISWAAKFRCAQCKRGVIYAWYEDNRQVIKSDRKRCRVCNAKFRVIAVSR